MADNMRTALNGQRFKEVFDAFKAAGISFNENTAIVLVATGLFAVAEAISDVSTSLDEINKTIQRGQ